MMDKKIIFLGMACFAVMAQVGPALSATDVLSDPLVRSIVNDMEDIHIIKGELATIEVKTLQRVSVGDPDIADIVSAENDNLLIIGKADGKTPVFVWDDMGQRIVTVHVAAESLDQLQKRIERLLFAGDIKGVLIDKNEQERRIVVSGTVRNDQMEKFEKIMDPFEENGTAIVLVNEGRIEDMVQVDMQITEVSSSLFRKIGVEWFTGEIEREEEELLGQKYIKQTTTVNEDKPFSPDFVEIVPLWSGGDDTFKVGDFFRSQALVSRINAMVEEGNAKVLSKPKLVAVSGEEASILVGGEVPIRTSNTNENGIQENVEFKEYGVGMTIVPTVKKNKVDIVLSVDITDIDRANATDQDLAFLVRSAQTRLLLDDGETIVLAGLIKNTDSEFRKKVPYLADVPLLGMMFRSKRTPAANEDTELVLSMTPHIIRERPQSEEPVQTKAEYQPIRAVEKKPAYDEPAPMSTDMAAYMNSIQKMIAESIVYPPEAASLGWEGTVRVSAMILSDGTLAFALIEGSSGYDAIDQSALRLVKGLTYPPFPSSTKQQDVSVVIPIVYSQSH